MKNHEPKLEGMSDYYHMQLRKYLGKGKLFGEATKLAQGDTAKWLKEKNAVN